MVILGIECSAVAASCALLRDNSLIALSFSNVTLTHSETLLPMIENMLKSVKMDIYAIDRIAISNGPGSFTGIRIGISAVKGLAAARNIPCVGVSTLEAMAYMHRDYNGIVLGLMDARCNQFYNAVFRVKNGKIDRLSEDRASLFEEIYDEICEKYSDDIIIAVGDGAGLFCKKATEKNGSANIILADESNILQRADGVVLAATDYINNGKECDAEALLPFYLRLPQAERELKKRKEESK